MFEQAETPAFAQFLLAGSVELLGVRGRVEALIELLQPVDMVIPAAVVSGQPYLMRARVYEEAHLLLISAETFRHAMTTDNALCRAVLGCLSAQFRRQVRMAKNLKLRSAEERVGCYLVALLQRDDRAVPLRLPIDKKEIASQLGMSREVFSRALSGMEKFGMRVVGKVLEVDDAAAAQARFRVRPSHRRRRANRAASSEESAVVKGRQRFASGRPGRGVDQHARARRALRARPLLPGAPSAA